MHSLMNQFLSCVDTNCKLAGVMDTTCLLCGDCQTASSSSDQNLFPENMP